MIRLKIKEKISPTSAQDASEQQKVNGGQDGGEDGGQDGGEDGGQAGGQDGAGQAGNGSEGQAGHSHDRHCDGAVLVAVLDTVFYYVHMAFIIIIHYTWLLGIVAPSADRTD